MFSLNKKLNSLALLLFVSALSFEVMASDLRPPQALYSINDLVREFRSPLKTKVEDLKKNYRAQSSPNLVEYTSHEKVNCLFRDWEPGAVLTRIEYFFRKNGEEALDLLRYAGCGNDITLVEKFLRFDKSATPLKFSEFSRAELNFELQKSISRYHYTLENKTGEELFSLSARWLDASKVNSLYSFSIRGQEFMVVRYTKTSQELRVTYTFKGFDVSYQYPPYFKQAFSSEHNQFTFKVLVKKERPDSPIYLSSFDAQLAQNTFIQYFSFWAIRQGMENVKKLVNFHLYWFPPTEFVSTGGQSQRLINELRLALNRILNNTNINLVEVYLRKLIESVESGFITDRRPAE